jgi:hypothetical protein
MTASSGTCDTHGAGDSRNCVGYALSEIGIGTLAGACFTDLVQHSDLGQTQTVVWSVDPWHGPGSRETGQEQPGLDCIFTNGITRGQPAIVPVGMAYGVPQDAAAEIAYLGGARLSHRGRRAGRGAGRAVHAARGLRRPLPTVGERAARRRSRSPAT